MLPLSRRTLLKGAGAALALPLLDAMLPRRAWGAPNALARTRMAFVYVPNGAIMEHWTPTAIGVDFELPKTLKPLEDVRSEVLVLSGLAHDKARPNGDGPGDHARCSGAFLTAAQPKKSDSDIHLGQSIDQYAADRIGRETRLPSLELGIEAGRQAGRCDSGYGCAYQSNISWKSATVPTSKEVRPRAAFERLFGTGESAEAAAKRIASRRSILDFVSEDAKRLTDRVGAGDRAKLDEYFTSVREVEQRIASTANPPVPDMEIPREVPKDFAEHVRLMFDLMTLAFQTDSVRVSTFMLANSGSNRTYKEIDVPDAHHAISHHQRDAEKMSKLQKIDEYMVEQFAYFLSRLRSIPEGEGTLLDNSMIVYGGATSDANRHRHDNLPILLAGRGGGAIDPGRHFKYDKETPMANLFLSLLDGMGVAADRFGDSTGRAKGLKA